MRILVQAVCTCSVGVLLSLQLLQKGPQSEVANVVSMYAAVLEGAQSSLTFKVNIIYIRMYQNS